MSGANCLNALFFMRTIGSEQFFADFRSHRILIFTINNGGDGGEIFKFVFARIQLCDDNRRVYSVFRRWLNMLLKSLFQINQLLQYQFKTFGIECRQYRNTGEVKPYRLLFLFKMNCTSGA